MFDFAEKTSDMSAIEILNYYRNLYYAEPQVTERGILANAINDVLGIINSQKEEIEQWQEEANSWQTIACQQSVDALSFSELIENAYKRGAKEFAERLKEKSETYIERDILGGRISYKLVKVENIDNLLKEMVGEEE